MKIELANFLLEESCAFFAALCTCWGGRMDKERDGWHLASSSKYDFTAFFDVLSVKRYSEYTSAHSYLLHLEINGKTAIFQTAVNACDYVLQRDGRLH